MLLLDCLANHISFSCYCTCLSVWCSHLPKRHAVVYITGFWLSNRSMIETVYEAPCGKHSDLFCPLAVECVRIKQSSPPRWVVMNYLWKVFWSLFGLPLSSFNAFGCYLLQRCTVFDALSVKPSATALLSLLYLSFGISFFSEMNESTLLNHMN